MEDSVRLAAYRAALAVVHEAIEDDPGNPAVYLHLGWAHIGLRDYAAADTAFDKAEEIYPPTSTRTMALDPSEKTDGSSLITTPSAGQTRGTRRVP